jgi:hypothetical protein
MNAPATQPGIDLAAARSKVAALIATVKPPGKYPWQIRDENPRDLDGFWLFSWAVRSDFWPKRKWAPTAGNSPIAVRKSDGAMFMYHLLCPWDEFVKRVESGNLHPYGCRIEIQ